MRVREKSEWRAQYSIYVYPLRAVQSDAALPEHHPNPEAPCPILKPRDASLNPILTNQLVTQATLQEESLQKLYTKPLARQQPVAMHQTLCTRQDRWGEEPLSLPDAGRHHHHHHRLSRWARALARCRLAMEGSSSRSSADTLSTRTRDGPIESKCRRAQSRSSRILARCRTSRRYSQIANSRLLPSPMALA